MLSVKNSRIKLLSYFNHSKTMTFVPKYVSWSESLSSIFSFPVYKAFFIVFLPWFSCKNDKSSQKPGKKFQKGAKERCRIVCHLFLVANIFAMMKSFVFLQKAGEKGASKISANDRFSNIFGPSKDTELWKQRRSYISFRVVCIFQKYAKKILDFKPRFYAVWKVCRITNYLFSVKGDIWISFKFMSI